MKKVVLADDNYIVSEGIKLNIDWNELNAEIVLIAKSGQEVLNYIIDNHVDLIITDPPYNLAKFMNNRDTNLSIMRENFFGVAG